MKLMRRASSWIRPAVLAFACVAPVWTIFWLQSHIVVALLPLFLSHLLLLYPTLVPRSQWWGPVIRSFETSEREVWITIDDGPSPVHTEKILDALERHGAKATFFVIGTRAAKSPKLIEKILQHGHTVENHTFTHPSGTFWCAGPKRIANEIDECAEIIAKDTKRSSLLFRTPAGHKNFLVHPALTRRGMLLIGWTVRGFDTVRRDPAAVAATINRRVRPGAIILLHEGHQIDQAPAFHPRCIELTLEGLAENGYRCVIPKLEQLRPSVER